MNIEQVTGPVTVTITLEDAGEQRRFNRIFLNQSRGEVYSGPQTNAFAQRVVDTLGITEENSRPR